MARFRPEFWPTVIVLIGLALLIALGTWQLERRTWKMGLIAEREAALALPPLTAADFDRLSAADADGYALRRVRLTGTWQPDRSLAVAPRSHNGRSGIHVITPLVLAGGRTVLVNRGWAPTGWKPPSDAPAAATVTGVARRGGRRGAFTPDNVPDAGQWYYIDVGAMASKLGLDRVAPLYVQVLDGGGNTPPIADPSLPALPNRHLEYALTWYALAIALIAIYILYHRRRARNRS